MVFSFIIKKDYLFILLSSLLSCVFICLFICVVDENSVNLYFLTPTHP